MLLTYLEAGAYIILMFRDLYCSLLLNSGKQRNAERICSTLLTVYNYTFLFSNREKLPVYKGTSGEGICMPSFHAPVEHPL